MAALQPLLDFISSIANSIASISNAAHSLGFGGGGGGGHAIGGDLDPGWNLVGEQGPEAIFFSGSRATVFTNSQTRSMMAAPVQQSGGGGKTHVSPGAGKGGGAGGKGEPGAVLRA